MQHHFDTRFALAFGVEESIIIHNLDFSLTNVKAHGNRFFYKENTYWTRRSLEGLSRVLYYIKYSALRTALRHLKESKVIRTKNFNKTSYDRTMWYTFHADFLVMSVKDGAGNFTPVSSILEFCSIKDCEPEMPDSEESHHLSNSANGKLKTRKSNRQNSQIDLPEVTIHKDKADLKAEKIKDKNTHSIFSLLQKRIAPDAFRTWIEPIELQPNGSSVRLNVPDDTYKTWIQLNYADVIQDACAAVLQHPVTLTYEIG